MKRFICILLAIVFILTFSVPAFADYAFTEASISVTAVDAEQSRAEETVWYFRWYDGMIQRRLWSITYGYWLTDWETIGYYDP